jgi:Thaumatin family/Ricin-type beta-trefoil lectin domain
MNGKVFPRNRLVVLLASMVALTCGTAIAADFTVVNKCSYTVYPGIYPATYANGGWQMSPGTQVSFTLNSGWIGRIWGRTGCNSANPAVCSTGQCGGEGLQCAGTTGVAGTSLAEFNLNANGTDWYDVSYVDGFDNPIGISISNASCASPNTCSSTPVNACSGDLKSGSDCLSPCTVFNSDQFCCRGAYGTQATCVVANWPAAEQSFVTNIHNSCPGEYAYAYDDANGLHTCATGSNYTVTFCPNGSGGGGGGTSFNGSHTLTPGNATGSRLDDYLADTANGSLVDIYTANGSPAQTWVLSNNGVVPSGYYNIAISFGAYCLAAAGSEPNSAVNIQACNGSAGQAWEITGSSGNYQLHPATNPALCLDVYYGGTANETPVLAYTCTGNNNQSWAIN